MEVNIFAAFGKTEIKNLVGFYRALFLMMSSDNILKSKELIGYEQSRFEYCSEIDVNPLPLFIQFLLHKTL